MEMSSIDINVDVGEGIGNELQLMPYVSSCNIACGGHAGTNETMQNVVKLAKTYKVKIGAHPSFPDVENFGRQPMDMSCIALFTSIKNQINSLASILEAEHAVLHHIKPHGALYNMAATNLKTAATIIEVMKSIPQSVKLYVPFNSVIEDLAIQNNIPITYEVFADRNYNTNLTLVARTENNALIHDADTMFEHVYRIISESKVKTIQGVEVAIKAETFCIHGDNLQAENLLKTLHLNLDKKGIKVL